MVMALNSSYTNTTGSAVDSGVVGAGAQNCAYCNGAAGVSYASASSPLGTYGAATQISTNGTCQGQPDDASVVTANGITSYLFLLDNYIATNNAQVLTNNGPSNQGLANLYVEPI